MPTLPTAPGGSSQRLAVAIRGAVQGVGFRPFVYRLATSLNLTGWVRNSSEGVFLEVEGPEPSLREFLARLETERPAVSSIHSLEATVLDAAGFARFEIRESGGGNGLKVALVMPDLATCPDCLRDILDPTGPRYRYPFTNCTNCGPRYSIIEALPYDRAATTMKAFVMCPECAREFADPADRRFHAQPNACPRCGPQLQLWDRHGARLRTGDDALLAAAEAIRAGQIAAVKGLGGFHLLVDARNQDAVEQLRARKRRQEKPFALMYSNFDAVSADCEISAVERRLLRSPESPIVLLRRRPQSRVAPAVAPRNPYLGVLLPYTPLHHLLLRELGFAVVATSGNLGDEPICTDEREAVDRLRGIADVFLVHNRPILRPVDDSIVREIAGRELVLRRARGFAPLPLRTNADLPPLIALGAHQKSTIAFSRGAQVFISQHLGDLDSVASVQVFERAVASLSEIYQLRPEALVCDLHPGYTSTGYALGTGQPLVRVQHHYAHALACMAENAVAPPALAITWDGSGFGPDGTVWGGEFLRITGSGYERLAHLRHFRLLGSEAAVRQPRRIALAILYELFGDAALEYPSPARREFSPAELALLATMLRRGLYSPLTSSAGRLFDAVASLLGIRQRCSFEGQAAMELEFAADPRADLPDDAGADLGDMEILGHENDPPWILDWAPIIRRLLTALKAEAGASRESLARGFHLALARALVAVAGRAGMERVLLTGGCFQNRILTECAVRHLTSSGFRAYWHQRIPPNDGGISLGQIMAAARSTPASENRACQGPRRGGKE